MPITRPSSFPGGSALGVGVAPGSSVGVGVGSSGSTVGDGVAVTGATVGEAVGVALATLYFTIAGEITPATSA